MSIGEWVIRWYQRTLTEQAIAELMEIIRRDESG